MHMKLISSIFVGILIIFLATIYSCKQEKKSKETVVSVNNTTNLKEALSFYASFDKGVDADFSLGDKRMFTVPNRKAMDSAQVGLQKPDISRQEGKGKYGSALVFTERSKGTIYYPSEKNIAYN